MMQSLIIEPTKSTPKIHFDEAANELLIAGESYPENTAQFYEPVFEWIDEYLKNLKGNPMKLVISLVYFNSSSSKVMMDILDDLDQAAEQNKQITIHWHYHPDNDVALEYWNDLNEDLIHVQMKPIPEVL